MTISVFTTETVKAGDEDTYWVNAYDLLTGFMTIIGNPNSYSAEWVKTQMTSMMKSIHDVLNEGGVNELGDKIF